jgi:Flp pilus assembly protein TadD
MYRLFRSLVFMSALSLIAVCTSAQDLGSSNKLFGGSKKGTAPKATTAKTPVKSKTTATKRKAPPKKASTTAKKKPAPAAAKPKATATKSAPKTPPRTVVKTDTAPKTSDTAGRFGEFTTPSRPITKADEERYDKLIEDGNKARDDRNYTSAESAYRRAKAIKPTDQRAIYGLGNVYGDQQRWDESEAAYRDALKLAPNDPLALVALSYVLTQPISTANLGDRYEEAEKLARKAITLSPRNALAHDQLGVAMELRGLIGAETENAYRRAIQLDPSFAPSYAHLGRLLRRRGMTDESMQAYADALHRSNEVPTMIVVAEVLQSEQRYKESEQLLRDAVNDDPRNPAGLLLLGRALTALGEFREAESILRRSLAVSPNGFMANSMLGSLYARQGRMESAETALMQASRTVPVYEKRRLSQQFEMVGDGYFKAGKRREAARAYRQAVSLDTQTESLAAKLARTRGA